MRNPLNKRLKRELTSNLGRYLSIALLMIATISLISSLLVVSDSFASTFDENFDRLNVEDGRFLVEDQVNDTTKNELEDLGINIYENFYKDIDYKDSVIRVYTNRAEIDLVEVMSGDFPKASNEIALDRLYASKNEIEIGDELAIGDTSYKVSGFVAMPDYTALFKNNMDIMMDAFHFGVAIVPPESLDMLEGEMKYNYSYLCLDQDLSLKQEKDLSKEIASCLIKNGVEVSSICIQEENQSLKFIKDDLGTDVPMIKVLLVIILVVIAYVFAILAKSTIEDESAIIGTLLSSGYTRGEILTHYLEAPILVTVLSAIIGNILGYTVMLEPSKSFFYDSYSLPPCNIRFSMEAFILTSIVPIMIMLVINTVLLRLKLSLTPLQFLRRELGKKKNRKAIRLPNISFLSRFHLRVILQNKSNYITLFVGVFIASTLLMFGLGLEPIINDYIDSIDENVIAQYQYTLNYPVELDSQNAEKYNICSLETYYKTTNRNLEVVVYGMEQGTELLKNTDLTAGSDHIYVSTSLLKKLGLKAGDTLELDNPYTEKHYSFTVYESYEYPAGFAVFMNINDFNRQFEFDENSFRGYFSNEELDIDDNYVISVITAEEMNSLGKQMMSSFTGIIPIVVCLALIIYFVFMYILTKVVIDKNAINISYMKVFGYEDKEIKRLYLRTTTYVVIGSLIICPPLETFAMVKLTEVAMTKVNGYLEVSIPLYLQVEIACIGIVTYFLINLFHVWKVKKINMVAALKARE